jgi:hypothetical protein
MAIIYGLHGCQAWDQVYEASSWVCVCVYVCIYSRISYQLGEIGMFGVVRDKKVSQKYVTKNEHSNR